MQIEFEQLDDVICKYAKKPEPSVRNQPNFWKEIPRYHENYIERQVPKYYWTTVKACPGISDAIQFGYTLFFPLDVYVDATSPDKLLWEVPMPNLDDFYVETNPSWMLDGFIAPAGYNKNTLKLNPLFGVHTPPGYSTWFTHPIHHNELPFIVVDAIIDTDVFPSKFPITFFVREGFKGVIKAGTPFVQVIPFKRDEWTATIIEKNENELQEQQKSMLTRFSGAYKKLLWNRKKFESCPINKKEDGDVPRIAS